MVSPLTYKILAYINQPGEIDMSDCVDWAIEMMSLGYESPNLYIVAGMQKPVLYIEVVSYLKAALHDLKLKELEGDDALISYASYYILEISREKNIKANLYTLCRFYTSSDFNNLLQDFYLLHWAWDEYDHGCTNQYYYPSATKENITQLTVEAAQQWLENNQAILKHIFL